MVTKIVVDPETHEPGYLVVQRGRIRPRRKVVPVSLVSDVTAEAVVLATHTDELDAFPDYEVTVQKGEYHKPVPIGSPRPYAYYTPPTNQGYMVLRQRNVPDTTVSVEKGMAILDTTGLKVGQVDGLVMDSNKKQAIQILLQQSDPRNTRHRIIPANLVDDVRADMVHLRITAEDVYDLSFYEQEQK
jgi:sporulation protein YlmC with PRC-barrel domain